MPGQGQYDRIRVAFGLTHNAPLPYISEETLLTYHRYLTAKLNVPFQAIYDDAEVVASARKRIIVTGLLEPDDDDPFDEDGLICIVRSRGEEIKLPLDAVEVKKKHRNFHLLSDYAYWFHNSPWLDEAEAEAEDADQAEDEDEDDEEQEASLRDAEEEIAHFSFWQWAILAIVCTITVGILGAMIGPSLPAAYGVPEWRRCSAAFRWRCWAR